MKYEIKLPFRYEPSGDSDGELVGTDHFVLDADGNELACPPGEEVARLFAASHKLLEALRPFAKVATQFGGESDAGAEWTVSGADLKVALEAVEEATRLPARVSADSLTFTRGDWQYTGDMGDHGRLDTIIDVGGHPTYDSIRYYLFPGGGGDLMEWANDGTHYTNDEAPIPQDVREKVMKMVVEDLCERLKAIDC